MHVAEYLAADIEPRPDPIAQQTESCEALGAPLERKPEDIGD